MPTRREFLIATCVVGASPVLAQGVPVRASVSRYFAEIACNDTRQFARYCGIDRVAGIGDPGAALFALERELAGGNIERIVGLSRPSSRFLAEQLSAPYGFTVSYAGSHRYVDGALQHTLYCGPACGASLARRLRDCSESWSSILARALRRFEQGSEPLATFSVAAAATAPADSPRFLSSFVLART